MKPDRELALALREAIVTANNGCMQWSTLLALMQRAADALDSRTVEVQIVRLSEPESQSRIHTLIAAVKANDEWHRTYDDFGGYEESDLGHINAAALTLG